MTNSTRPIAIVGSGGLGRKVKWLIDRINSHEPSWEIVGFYDDCKQAVREGYPPFKGTVAKLLELDQPMAVACAIASPAIRKNLVEMLSTNPRLFFPSLIDPDTVIADSVAMGTGNIVMVNSVLSPDVVLADHIYINTSCDIGHDVVISNYCTLYPAACVSGNVQLGEQVEVGANATILQDLSIADEVRIGAGAVVTRSIEEIAVTYAGVPARKIN